MNRGMVIALLLAAGATGCGEADSSAGPARPASSPTAVLPADGPVRAVTTVLDEGEGPVMCLGMVMQSMPPQCSGTEVAGWAWDEHPEHEDVGGVRWGEFTMVGAWDGTTFTPAEARPSTADDSPAPDDPAVLFATRCDAPSGGWVPVDPANTNQQSLSAAHRVAEKLPGYALSWGDQSINPRWADWQELVDGGRSSLEVEKAMNDPRWTILNVAVTDDVAGAEAAVREVWGGPLCVSTVRNTHQDLRRVADELSELPGGLTRGFGSISNVVEISVVFDDGSIQAWVDEQYGPGVVEVTSALTPVG